VTPFRYQKVKGQCHQAALSGCSSDHLQGAGAYYGGCTTGCTACSRWIQYRNGTANKPQ